MLHINFILCAFNYKIIDCSLLNMKFPRSNLEFTVSKKHILIILKIELIKLIKNPDNIYESIGEAGIISAKMISSDGKYQKHKILIFL